MVISNTKNYSFGCGSLNSSKYVQNNQTKRGGPWLKAIIYDFLFLGLVGNSKCFDLGFISLVDQPFCSFHLPLKFCIRDDCLLYVYIPSYEYSLYMSKLKHKKGKVKYVYMYFNHLIVIIMGEHQDFGSDFYLIRIDPKI